MRQTPIREPKSPLNRKRIERIPEVYHRPQLGSGVYSGRYLDEKGKFRPPVIKKGERMPAIVPKTYENPNVNSLKAFDTVPNELETSIFLASRFIVMHNHPHRKDANDMERARDAFNNHLRDCNICHKCRKPIKTKGGLHKRKKLISHLKAGRFVSAMHYVHRNERGITFADIKTHCDLAVLPKLDADGNKIGTRIGYVVIAEAGAQDKPYYIETFVENGHRMYAVRERSTGKLGEILKFVPSEYRVEISACECNRNIVTVRPPKI
jgi:hypothetical protein